MGIEAEGAEYSREYRKKHGWEGHYCGASFCGSKFICKTFNDKLILCYSDKYTRDECSVVVNYCPFCGFKTIGGKHG